MTKLGPLVRVRSAEVLEGFEVRLEFEDGTQKEIDLELYLRGPIFEPIRNDPTVFRSMEIEGGTITWDNGAYIDPDDTLLRPETSLDGGARTGPLNPWRVTCQCS